MAWTCRDGIWRQTRPILQKRQTMKIGIVGAMAQETALLQRELLNVRRQTRGMREYLEGTLYGRDVVLVLSRMAKVAAASTVTTLIEVFGVELVVYTGVAGAADASLEVGDVVLGTLLVQHDLDARPLFRRFEVPLLNKVAFEPPPWLVSLARQSAELYLRTRLPEDLSAQTLREFGIQAPPRVHEGLIISGDQFIANPATVRSLQSALQAAGLPAAKCVEMEGAAVAQVCHEHGVPVIVMRTISDRADHSAAVDFVPFVERVASHFTSGIVQELISKV
jgi:adenosylhomocysteine nucleosidase